MPPGSMGDVLSTEGLIGALSQDQGASERLLRAFFELPVLIAVLRGPQHIYAFANRAYLEASGVHDAIGKPFGQRPADNELAAALKARLDTVYATGEPFHASAVDTNVHAVRKDGRTRAYFDVCFEAIRDADGKVDGILIQSIDVTSRVLVTRALKKQEELASTVLANAPIVLWAVDASGVITMLQGRELSAIGLAPGSLVGDSAFEAFAKSPDVERNTRRALAGESFTGSTRIGDVAFETMYRPLRDDGGAIVGAMGVSTNVTERRRAEEEHAKLQAQLLQVQKLESLGVLAGGIAHDFNNLLTGILGSASAALLSLPSSSPACPAVENVVLAARRAADLTRQLLAYSGKGHFEVRPIDLSGHVRELATLLETTLPKKVQLRLELGQVPSIEADVAQLQQVVMNLVVNAAEAMGDDRGTVLVTTGTQLIDEPYASTLLSPSEAKPGRYVFLEVHDTGCGMTEETKAKIFDPFFTTKFTGRGLGLAAVLGIVRGHRGALKIYSSVGRGTTFKVFFPASDAPSRKDIRVSHASFHGTGLVLLVDDDDGVRRAARMILELFGFDVVEARDGREALRVFAPRATDIVAVLLDMTMPEMGGEETFRELRRLRDDVPVILSSGYNEVEATRRFTSKGLAGFLQKPFTSKELGEKLSAALAARTAR